MVQLELTVGRVAHPSRDQVLPKGRAGSHQVAVLGIRGFEARTAVRQVVNACVGSLNFGAEVESLELQDAEAVQGPGQGLRSKNAVRRGLRLKQCGHLLI